MRPAGFHFRISSSEAVPGRTTEKTRASRIRRAISCVYWEPKSRTTIGRELAVTPPPPCAGWREPAPPRAPPAPARRLPPREGRERRHDGREERSRGDTRREPVRPEDDRAARGEEQEREDRREGAPVSRHPAPFRDSEEGAFREAHRPHEEERRRVRREEEQRRLHQESDLGGRLRNARPQELLDEGIGAEARVAAPVRQEGGERSQEKGGREEEGDLAQEAHEDCRDCTQSPSAAPAADKMARSEAPKIDLGLSRALRDRDHPDRDRRAGRAARYPGRSRGAARQSRRECSSRGARCGGGLVGRDPSSRAAPRVLLLPHRDPADSPAGRPLRRCRPTSSPTSTSRRGSGAR